MSFSPYPVPRNPCWQAAGVLLVVAIGLASRALPLFPAALGKYPGDALWALMIFVALGALWPGARGARLGWAALLICYAVELSQLYQAPWIRQIRSHTLGHLVLGSHFGWIDFIAYTVGVAIGVPLDALAQRLRGPAPGFAPAAPEQIQRR
ncbi:DUF2809 domain-containing protein [Janthinobacterium fluminis]|uniref:DUF2809 domain-containing protein n=1 Tax=Janthinobacterium fluminis TaxID=2987524 RepID=A0ABT5K5F1_9BURK|nr:DUF2809 domain-containing protein [Janthinobacterium fluminis]MDC8759643.1 DUF2809 domain-containing protein [Janthinobacterium fluminis]